MFNDLFHLIAALDHDYREENGERVHDYKCRRCAINVRLRDLSTKIRGTLKDMEFAIGDPPKD